MALRLPSLRSGDDSVDRVGDELRGDITRLGQGVLSTARLIEVARVQPPAPTGSNPYVLATGRPTKTRFTLYGGVLNAIPHGLGRVPTGSLVLYQDAFAYVYNDDSQAAQFDPKKYLCVRVYAQANVTMAVF